MTQTANAINLLIKERYRQIDEEGWSIEHDDQHKERELGDAAACYLFYTEDNPSNQEKWLNNIIRIIWPWDSSWFKPYDRKRNLVKAGALIIAELERLERIDLNSSKA